MAINFSALPDSVQTSNPLFEGKHKVRIEKAEMKTPRDTSKPDYLNLQYKVLNDKDEVIGTIFDMIIESDKPLLQYKLKRFILGFKIPVPNGPFELRDLCKIVTGKTAIAELTVQKSEQYGDKTVVDATKDEIYYPIEDNTTAMNEAMKDMPFMPADDEDEEF